MSNLVFRLLSVILISLLFGTTIGHAQKKRLKPPKRESKVSSVDLFVDKSFNLYNKVFVYDSLTQAGIDIPAELEDELAERAEQDLDSLWQLAPDIVDDISDASFMKQAKATVNLNKAKKALKYCGLIIKSYFIPEEED